GVLERRRRLERDAQRLGRRELALLAQAVLEAAAAHELHRVVVLLALLADVVDLDDVGVVQLPGGARLAEELRDEVLVLHELRREELQRDLAIERDLDRAVDRPHAAAPDAFEQAVAAEDLLLLRLGEALDEEREHRVADLQLVARLELGLRDALVVDVDAVQAVEVLDEVAALELLQPDVVARDEVSAEDHVAVGVAPERVGDPGSELETFPLFGSVLEEEGGQGRGSSAALSADLRASGRDRRVIRRS